jgi:hypothetical protein
MRNNTITSSAILEIILRAMMVSLSQVTVNAWGIHTLANSSIKPRKIPVAVIIGALYC